MESLSRPPHRRKHSATTAAFSFKNPYDGVLLPSGGERKSLEAHEYSEIFSGSSAIPVLDLSGLDDRVGSADPRSSKIDYSNIFGGLRNDDVAVPYQELFNGSSKKSKPRIPADTLPPLQESSSRHSSGKTKTPSAEAASDQSVDGGKQQFNMSFNRTSQRNIDAPNGKTHIAELRAVPGFTYFVNGGTPQMPKTENDRLAPPLKREVSRTWSFAAEVEAVKGKGGSSPEKSRTPDKSKSHNANEVNFKSQVCDSKNPRKSNASIFSSEEDASEKVAGESSPPFFGEEFDENSVAAVSAAALKKAIDQAQESIRVAKMIMEKKREGFRDGLKQRPKSNVKVIKKEKHEEFNPVFTGNDGKSNHYKEKIVNAANVDMERVWENVETAKENGETHARGGKLFASDCSRGKTLYLDEKVSAENVYAAEMHRDVGNSRSSETLEDVEITVDNMKRSEAAAEQVEKTLIAPFGAPQREEAERSDGTFDRAEGSENRVETVLDASRRTREQKKDVDEAGEKSRICLEDEASEQRVDNDMDDKAKCEKKFEDNVEDLTVLRAEFDNFMDESRNRFVNLEQDDTEKKFEESVFKSKEDGIIYDEEEKGTMQETARAWVNEAALDEKNYETKSHDFAGVGNEAYEQEFDDKEQNHVRDGDELTKVETGDTNTSEYEAAETIVNEANNCAIIEKSTCFDSEELMNNLRSQFQENAYKVDIDEVVDVNTSDDAHTTDEACDFGLNDKAEQYEKAVENCEEKDNESEQSSSHMEDNEISGKDTLNRSASGEIFVESAHNAFAGLSAEKKLPEGDNAVETRSEIHDAARECDAKINRQNLAEVNTSDTGKSEFDLEDVTKVSEQTSETSEESVPVSGLESVDGSSSHESEECAENADDETSNKEELEDGVQTVSNERSSDEEKTEVSYSRVRTEPNEVEKPIGLNMDKNKENLAAKESLQNDEKNEHQQRIEAIKKGREREKDRIVVERAIREARERAFVEARERAERAAVEKAAAEVRQRVLSEAREKLEKSSAKQTSDKDKASTEAKRRAERAAVERATAEARERALEKAMSHKSYTEARTPSSSGLKHSFSSSDLENGSNTESAQRRKARLERHQRIMERAAKALEEKNMRDRLVQKEQAERDRLSESLNADIKRWAAGKEGNLRALLSTLQYILGPDSSWQPISLTEIITTAAVKKAYRKATLYVHPDKLQQRGATIQQKYICEKVFDLLKAAWNRFNSDER
ncbi:hypothetical protein ABFX02_03G062500 [Erythranthe guttata]